VAGKEPYATVVSVVLTANAVSLIVQLASAIARVASRVSTVTLRSALTTAMVKVHAMTVFALVLLDLLASTVAVSLLLECASMAMAQ